jgi:acetylornithine deacetylase/succinyl-diaminopimelate desuccinylase-like protein
MKTYSPFERKRRLAARVALYGSFIFLMVVLVVASALLYPLLKKHEPPFWESVDYSQVPEVQLLQEYVRIDTSTDSGSELDGARFLAAKLEAAGIPVHIEQLGDRQANLWAILEGEDPRALVLHNHIDVYTVEDPDKWDFPPFGGVIKPPYLYGRGAFDMKSVAIAQLEALLAVARSGKKPKRSIIFLATGSEEIGSELGTRRILDQHPELASRFWAVLTEGGIIEPLELKEIKYWGIEFAQKQFASAYACSASREQLQELREEILAARDSVADLRLTPAAAAFTEAYAPSRTRESFRRLLSDPQETIRQPTEFRQLPEYLKALFRDELIAFRIEEDPEGGFRMRLFFHLLAGSDLEEVRRRLLPDWMTHGVALVIEDPLGTPEASPLDHVVYRTLHDSLQATLPDSRVGPLFLSWTATDSRFFRTLGIPSYGFSPFLIFATDTYRVDTINERIGLPGYVEGVRIYKEVVQTLANDIS